MASRAKKLYGIFINSTKANCSIYESGLMMFESLLLSNRYTLDYLEIDERNRTIPGKYDFFAFNYHHATMGWLNTKSLRELPGLKITFVLETLPNDPFVLCPSEDFDAYCALDPTMNVADKRVYAFSRPLEIPSKLIQYHELPVPVIGSFGFATPGKGFELIVDAVNKEFEEAIVKLNIPSSTYADEGTWHLHKQNYAEYLSGLCKETAKEGVQVIVTHDFMTKDELIKWCGQNTLNCFLYNRNQPGLSATTDQAITSRRPLAISTNETFRHIHRHITPYPFRSLQESIAISQPDVLQIQQEWAPSNFAKHFEKVLQDFNLFEKAERDHIPFKKIRLRKKFSFPGLASRVTITRERIKKLVGPLFKSESKTLINQPQKKNKRSACKKNRILLVSHKEKQCGIHQYAVNLAEALIKSTIYSFDYIECSNQEELHQEIINTRPLAIIYNYYPLTMPWLTSSITHRYNIPQLGIMHEVTQEEADKATQEMFNYHLCPDPTLIENNPIVFKTKRLIPPYINTQNIPDIVTIGSFGFGFYDKGFERIVEFVQQEFDRAKILFYIPFNEIADKEGHLHALATAERCTHLVTKPGIELIINHRFTDKQQLLDFLAGNTLNAFFYDTEKHRGVSSTIEHALAVQRPMAITKCGMFRHVHSATPSICIEDSSLKQIIDNGIVPLVPF
ncbi:class I SAM-dependent methyltransferase, partial [Candidatus Pacearchaeota archaeon]|nr:class I SAM-dependent methyltransferase [Candidatus Pacearchaeota archaeon]